MKNNKTILIRGSKVLLGLIIVISCSLLYNSYQESQMLLRKKITQCYVYKVEPYKKPIPPTVSCSYKIKGQVYFAGYTIEDIIPFSQLEKLKGKNILVVCDSIEPQKKRILLIKKDFERFNIPYPDSLNWVKGMLEE